MTPVRSQSEVGSLLRQWRERRRVTQLELALDAGISARHLSFVETGRSKPGREMREAGTTVVDELRRWRMARRTRTHRGRPRQRGRLR